MNCPQIAPAVTQERITRRDLPFDEEASKGRSNEEICHLQARHWPGFLPHDCGKKVAHRFPPGWGTRTGLILPFN